MAEVSPLLVLLTCMRRKWAEGDEDGAVQLAKAAAPYVHPRAQPARSPTALSEVPDDELDELGDGSGAGAGVAPGDPDVAG